MALVLPKKVSCGTNQAVLLSRIDRFTGIRKGVAGPKSDFDKDETFTVQHNQVNFTESRPIVLRDQSKSLSPQVAQRLLLEKWATFIP